MIHFLYGDALASKPVLAHSMFMDRAEQFKKRLGWDVRVDQFGEERDEYDLLNPLYVIVTDEKGLHEASMRLLPTVGKTMVNDHFLEITHGASVESTLIWECTRFCTSPNAQPYSATKLMAAGGKVMQEFCIDHFVGVFDRKMLSVYRLIGSVPTIIGWTQSDTRNIGVGLWEYCADEYRHLLRVCGLSDVEMELFFANSDLSEVKLQAKKLSPLDLRSEC
ncbi:acyl-homoserine-lactone synthase [uncultured Tateyamaria sp.]|uniref:acyl-homoserine-lactone synthase n=1 Tax=uncultured Tateyamaria sp. TaxID=455651 RepID=UPI00260EA5B6|nr:acyl-homoserine-lactone synthase [uncultured Tateyamaria sp.]